MDEELRNELKYDDPSTVEELFLENKKISSIALLTAPPPARRRRDAEDEDEDDEDEELEYTPLQEFVNLVQLSLNAVNCHSLEGFPHLPQLRRYVVGLAAELSTSPKLTRQFDYEIDAFISITLYNLTLADNKITNGLEALVTANLSNLKHLDVSNNRIADVSVFAPLVCVPFPFVPHPTSGKEIAGKGYGREEQDESDGDEEGEEEAGPEEEDLEESEGESEEEEEEEEPSGAYQGRVGQAVHAEESGSDDYESGEEGEEEAPAKAAQVWKRTAEPEADEEELEESEEDDEEDEEEEEEEVGLDYLVKGDIASDDSGQDDEFAPPAHEDEDDEEDLDADERDDDVPSSSAVTLTPPAKRKRPNPTTQGGGLEVDELGGDFGDELGGEEFSGFYQGGEE
ncbi:hypothetical protein BC937DRAFT_86449, partial [Endogone sp. FLAS-F59071]